MPSSQAAATERHGDRTLTHEPPKLKTALKTPPKQATNPLQFVKVGPCSLYRTAQEQLQKVQEVKKIKQEIRDDPEDWQSNLDNWKSSRRKRQEHIIERVVEVKKLELEEHDRQRRRSKTFSEMMEERGNRGRKLSISLAVYNEEDANDLSDLGIGTSSGKSSVSGDTHDDTHSVLSDRDSEIDKNHSDVDNTGHENGNDANDNSALASTSSTSTATMSVTQVAVTVTATAPIPAANSNSTTSSPLLKKETLNNGFQKNGSSANSQHEYDSATTATVSSPEPEEYTYEGAIRGYVSRVSQNIPRRSLADLDAKLDSANKNATTSANNSPAKTISLQQPDADKSNNVATAATVVPVVKVDILKRREIFEKATRENVENKNNNNNRLDLASTKSIKERLSFLERQKSDNEGAAAAVKNSPRHTLDSSSLRERFSREKLATSEKELKTRDLLAEELESVKPLRERLSNLEKLAAGEPVVPPPPPPPAQLNGELSAKSIKDRLISLDAARSKDTDKRSPSCFHEQQQANNRVENSTPSERSSSPDSEYRAPRATFHQSLDSLDADASSGPDTFERVQSLEELDYHNHHSHQTRRYPASSSSAEILNDTDREDSGIHTADASCSVSQADEPIEEEAAAAVAAAAEKPQLQQQVILEEKTEFRSTIETTLVETSENLERVEEKIVGNTLEPETRDAVLTDKGTAEISSSSSTSTSGEALVLSANSKTESRTTTNVTKLHGFQSSTRPVVYQSPRVPPRRSPPELAKPSHLPGLCANLPQSPRDEGSNPSTESPSEGLSTPDSSSTNTICSLNFSVEVTTDGKGLQSPAASEPTSASLSSPQQPPPDSKLCSPLPSPRSPSKIPTPLPRKSLPSSPTSPTSPTCGSGASSPGSPKPPVQSAAKPRSSLPLRTGQAPSEIPVPVKLGCSSPLSSLSPSSPSSSAPSPPPPTSPRTGVPPSPDARRRTVVEVCEKVVVSPGQVQVTPFITVERCEPSSSSTAEVKPENQQQQQQQSEVEETSSEKQEEAAAAPLSVPEPKEEPLVQQQQQQQPEKRDDAPPVIMESAILVQETLLQLQQESNKQPPTLTFGADKSEMQQPPSLPAVRPNTLALEKTTLCSDFLSPLSPMSKQILPLSFSSDEEIVTGLAFPLGPPTSVEPPKEKPPPPPVDLSDEENHPIEPLKRLNSTRRIKKEIRSRRSDFLGIEGFNDDELERELTLTKPPDMAALLAEERRIEQLHRRSYDTDSNYEQDSSHERDSGVELGQAEDWTKQPVSPDMSQHSRQSSEPFGASVTSSEEDEISKKEREIIEVLEREEQWRYENNREINSDIGEKLAHKLRELEEEKMQLERERASQDTNETQQQQQQQQQSQQRRRLPPEPTSETLRMNEENLRKQEQLAQKQDEAAVAAARQKQQEIEEQLAAEEKRLQMEKEARMQERERRAVVDAQRRQDELQSRTVEKAVQEKKSISPALSSNEEEYASRQEVLRVERELLQLEQEELKRQRNNLAYREQKQQQLQEQWKSLQDVAQPVVQQTPMRQITQQPQYLKPGPLNYRASMPNLQLQETSLGQRRRPPPPPIPPAKPLRLIEQRQRVLSIGNSRIPSADSIPQQVEAPLRSSCSATTLSSGQIHHGQQMSRQTLQALSAVPRPRIVQGDQWVQRRKSDIPRGAHDYNYQHWLIQEAEQRRISEKNLQRSPARKPHVTGTSVPYTASPPRVDSKALPDSIIQTITQRVQNRAQEKPLSPRRRLEHSTSQEHLHSSQHYQQLQQHKVHQSPNNNNNNNNNSETQEKMLSVSGKKKCSHCGDELGRGAAMIIESLRLFYHMECFKCCVCHVRLGDGLMGTDVRVRNHKLHCHNCYSSDDGVKFSCV